MSVNKIPNNLFTQGLTVSGGLVADALTVNGVAITGSGGGGGGSVPISTDINNNSQTNVPSTSVTYALKQTNDSQTTQISTNTTTLAAIQAQLENLYGASFGAWAGIGVTALASGATYLQKSGGTMTGSLALGTNNISTVKDVNFSNALIGGATSNIHCSNLVASNVFGTFAGDGSQLTNLNLTTASNFGTASTGTVTVGAISRNLILTGLVQADIAMGTTRSIAGGRDFRCSNAVITSNVYSGNVITTGNVVCGAGSFFLGDGSKLTGITATGADATGSVNFATSGSLAGQSSVYGSGLNYGGSLRIGGTIVDVSPTISINGGATTAVQGETVRVDSTAGGLNLNTLWDQATSIGKEGGLNSVILQGGSLRVNHQHPISPVATHTAKQTGLIQSWVIPLSGEQGPIAQTTGSGVLPWLMFRAPFSMNVYGARLNCMQASSSGAVQVDVRYYAHNTSISGSTVNSTTGTSIFATRLQMDSGLFSSVGSTGVAGNGSLVANPVAIPDDGVFGVYITNPGTAALGVKLTLYYTFSQP